MGKAEITYKRTPPRARDSEWGHLSRKWIHPTARPCCPSSPDLTG